METIVGGLAFFAIVAAHLFAVVALRDTREGPSANGRDDRADASDRGFWRTA